MYSFHQNFQISWIKAIHNILFEFVNIFTVYRDDLLHTDTGYLCLFSYFPYKMYLGFIDFISFSKEPTFGVLDPPLLFLLILASFL